MMNGQNKFASNKDSKVRIKVINELCISAATCVIHAPNTFDLDEDGIAYVKEGTWDEAQQIITAAASCPTTAIIIEDLDGNQIYPEVN
ncbi:ferredoxin [candidate division WWE3 bacterium]|jgi:ferredoxin|uniref:Ferredoxin n=1 Tax=candidate division WWE3 bacterium TaxID=2053526 RepID=A0A3A4ZA25_UNCKA|nr:MAG: ferredoxin [candidate division WWE3 bacterium]